MCCQVQVSATDWSLVRRSPTDCGASLCVIKKPRTRGGENPLPGCENTTTMGCNARKTNKQTVLNCWEKCLGKKFRKYNSNHVLKRLYVRCKNSYAMEFYTYLLTPWSRILLQKLTGSQLVKKLPTFYGTRKFITAFTTAQHLSLSWATTIQSMPPHPTSWRSLRLPEMMARYRIRSPGLRVRGCDSSLKVPRSLVFQS